MVLILIQTVILDESTLNHQSHYTRIPHSYQDIITHQFHNKQLASMYLKKETVLYWFAPWMEELAKKIWTAMKKWSKKTSYEKYGKRTKRQLSKFWRLDRTIKFIKSVLPKNDVIIKQHSLLWKLGSKCRGHPVMHKQLSLTPTHGDPPES